MLKQIIAGDSYNIATGISALEFGEVATLHIRGFVNFSVDAVNDEFQITADDTLAMPAGLYNAAIVITSGLSRQTVGQWVVEVFANPLDSMSEIIDLRTFNKKMLDALDAHLLGKATNDQLDHIRSKIEDKELDRMPLNEITALRDKYSVLVKMESGKFIKTVQYTFC